MSSELSKVLAYNIYTCGMKDMPKEHNPNNVAFVVKYKDLRLVFFASNNMDTRLNSVRIDRIDSKNQIKFGRNVLMYELRKKSVRDWTSDDFMNIWNRLKDEYDRINGK